MEFWFLLTLPYFACHAKKYNSAASGWPTRQKLTQKMQFPKILPFAPSIFSSGNVTYIIGICTIIPMNATPRDPGSSAKYHSTVRFKSGIKGKGGGRRTEDVVCRYPNQELVQYPTEHKNPCARRIRTPPPPNQWRIDMPFHEMINGLIPGSPVGANTRTVPPLRIEFPVAKSHNFRQRIEHGLEDSKKAG